MRTLIVLILAVALAGCAGMSREEQGAATGAILGVVVGVLAGNALDCQGCAAIGGAVGGIGGGALGASWGRELDRLDRQQINHTLEHQKSGQAIAWQNPDTGARHQVVARPAVQNQGRYCREFTDTVVVAGDRQQLHGTACRNPDGTWELVK